MSNKKRNNHLLSYPVLVLASDGDVDAINTVLKHYEGYIAALSMRTFYDEGGNPHLCVDDVLRRRLETKLITKILTFNAA
ncbi:MAG TPA: helix-turn-helix domain-containing protein [Sedimentibacter sp.]|nr:helix-turn-helix domain-containing protein [Sedimentibacter sp.]